MAGDDQAFPGNQPPLKTQPLVILMSSLCASVLLKHSQRVLDHASSIMATRELLERLRGARAWAHMLRIITRLSWDFFISAGSLRVELWMAHVREYNGSVCYAAVGWGKQLSVWAFISRRKTAT